MAEPANAARELSAEDAKVKGGAAHKASTGKMSREAMLLVNGNSLFFANSGTGTSGDQRAAGRSQSRASVPNPDRSPPPARRKNGKSAPPHPVSVGGLLQSPPGEDPDLLAGGKPPKNKRKAVKEDPGSKRRRMERGGDTSSEPQDPTAPPAVEGAGVGGGGGNSKPKRASSAASPAKDRTAGDAGLVPDSMPAAEPYDQDHTGAAAGGSKKPRKAKGQSAAAAQEASAACNASPVDHPAPDRAGGRPQAAAATCAGQPAHKEPTLAVAPARPVGRLPMAAPAFAAEPLGEQPDSAGVRAAQSGAAGRDLAVADPCGSGRQANCGTAAELPAAPITGAETGRRLPSTGTTPVKTFIPIPMPRMDEVGRHDRSAVVELQRQLAEVRALYDDLKATKIGDLDKVLAQQAQYTEEQVRLADHRADLWKAAAENAEAKLKSATAQEALERMAALEGRNEELLRETSLLMRRVAQLEKELVLAQQAYHNARAELVLSNVRPDHEGDAYGGSKGDVEEVDQLSHGDTSAGAATAEGLGVELVQHPSANAAPEPEDSTGTLRTSVGAVADGAGAEAALASADNTPGNRVGVQVPTPCPGGGAQFPSPSSQLLRLQGLHGTVPGSASHSGQCGLSTACQRIVSMLPSLRAPSSSVKSRPGTSSISRGLPAGSREQLDMIPISSNQSRKWGWSTECQRAVQMLPGIRVPSPSIQPRFGSGSAPSGGPADAGNDLTPTMANGGAGPPNIPPASNTRRSTGSPIDGICGSGQLTAGGASATADLSHAHGMGAPEAFAAQQEQYSFVDLKPVSTRNATHDGQLLPTDARGTGQWELVAVRDSVQPNDATSLQAALAVAAATTLPPSPEFSRQDALAGAGASVKGCVLPSAGDSLILGKPSPPRRTTGLPSNQEDAALLLIPAPVGSPNPSAGNLLSGSVASNQASCNIPGIVSRAMTQQQEAQRFPEAQGNLPRHALGNGSTSLAGMAATQQLPTHAQVPAQADGVAPPAQTADEKVLDNSGPQNAVLSSATPRTVTFKLMAAVLGWRVDVLSSASVEAYRLTHRTRGISFELTQVEVDDDDDDDITVTEDSRPCTSTPETFFEYTPLNLGDVADSLPPFLKESIMVPMDHLSGLLDKIHQAVSAAAKGSKA